MNHKLLDKLKIAIGVRPWTVQQIAEAHAALDEAIEWSGLADAAQNRDWAREGKGAPPTTYRRGTIFNGVGID